MVFLLLFFFGFRAVDVVQMRWKVETKIMYMNVPWNVYVHGRMDWDGLSMTSLFSHIFLPFLIFQWKSSNILGVKLLLLSMTRLYTILLSDNTARERLIIWKWTLCARGLYSGGDAKGSPGLHDNRTEKRVQTTNI